MLDALLYHPHSGKKTAYRDAKAWQKRWPHLPCLDVRNDRIADGTRALVFGGDGTWHALAQRAQPLQGYPMPSGTMNLWAHVNGQPTLDHPLPPTWHARTLAAHRCHLGAASVLATLNWSFGLDAQCMAYMHTRRHWPLSLRTFAALCQRPNLMAHRVIIDDQPFEGSVGGIFSYLPMYAMRQIRLRRQRTLAWMGIYSPMMGASCTQCVPYAAWCNPWINGNR